MKKKMLKLGKVLSTKEQRQVTGGNDERMGICILESGIRIEVPCDSTCPNGMKPFCFAW